MIVVNIHEAKARLSEYLDAVAGGERVMICNRNRPVAELVAVSPKQTAPRPIGGGPHTFDVPDSFFEPMPEDWLDEFYNGPVFPASHPPSRVAEKRATCGPRKTARRRR